MNVNCVNGDEILYGFTGPQSKLNDIDGILYI